MNIDLIVMVLAQPFLKVCDLYCSSKSSTRPEMALEEEPFPQRLPLPVKGVEGIASLFT